MQLSFYAPLPPQHADVASPQEFAGPHTGVEGEGRREGEGEWGGVLVVVQLKKET